MDNQDIETASESNCVLLANSDHRHQNVFPSEPIPSLECEPTSECSPQTECKSELSESKDETSFVTAQPGDEPVKQEEQVHLLACNTNDGSTPGPNKTNGVLNEMRSESKPTSQTNLGWQAPYCNEQVQANTELQEGLDSTFEVHSLTQHIKPLEQSSSMNNYDRNPPNSEDGPTLTNLDNNNYKQWQASPYSNVPTSPYSNGPTSMPSYMEPHSNMHGGPGQYNPNPGCYPNMPWQAPHYGQMPPLPPNGQPGMYNYPPHDADSYQMQYGRPQYPGGSYFPPQGVPYPQGHGTNPHFGPPRMPVRYLRCGRPPMPAMYHARHPYYPNYGNSGRPQTRPSRYPPMMPLIVGGRELKYNWPPPQDGQQSHKKRKRGMTAKSMAFNYGDALEEELGSIVQDEGYQLPPVVSPVTENSYELHLPALLATSHETSYNDEMMSQTGLSLDSSGLLLNLERQAEVLQELSSSSSDVTSGSSMPTLVATNGSSTGPKTNDLPYTPRASKITKATTNGTYNMLQEAMKERPDKAVKLAKMHFSKRMLTLYGWLYPNNTKRDMKRAIDRLWDKLPASEKEYYLSQAEGRFGTRATGVMINPQLAALPGLSEDLLKNTNNTTNITTMTTTTTTTSHSANDYSTETEDAVRNLLATDAAQQWASVSEDETPTKRNRLSIDSDNDQTRSKTSNTEVRRSSRKGKKRFKNLDFNSDEESIDHTVDQDNLKTSHPESDNNKMYEFTYEEMQPTTSTCETDDKTQQIELINKNLDSVDLNLNLLADIAAEQSHLYLPDFGQDCMYADEFQVGREVVVASDGDEMVGGEEGAGMGGLEMLGVIAESELELLRDQLDERNRDLPMEEWNYEANENGEYEGVS